MVFGHSGRLVCFQQLPSLQYSMCSSVFEKQSMRCSIRSVRRNSHLKLDLLYTPGLDMPLTTRHPELLQTHPRDDSLAPVPLVNFLALNKILLRLCSCRNLCTLTFQSSIQMISCLYPTPERLPAISYVSVISKYMRERVRTRGP